VKRAVIRLPSEVLVRLDRLARKIQAAHPTRAVSRAAVVRALLASALDVAEADGGEIRFLPPEAPEVAALTSAPPA